MLAVASPNAPHRQQSGPRLGVQRYCIRGKTTRGAGARIVLTAGLSSPSFLVA
jgi:hypothetical protein